MEALVATTIYDIVLAVPAQAFVSSLQKNEMRYYGKWNDMYFISLPKHFIVCIFGPIPLCHYYFIVCLGWCFNHFIATQPYISLLPTAYFIACLGRCFNHFIATQPYISLLPTPYFIAAQLPISLPGQYFAYLGILSYLILSNLYSFRTINIFRSKYYLHLVTCLLPNI